MKKILVLIAAATLFLTGCGVGNYTVVTGKADEALLSFSSNTNIPSFIVTVDGTEHTLEAVRGNSFKTNRNIKKTSRNTLILTPGAHDVTVKIKENQIYSKKIFVSAQEHKIIDL